MRAEIKAACAGLEGQTIVCALSGGRDSVALLHCLLSLKEELGISVAAAHFNHCLRGQESDGDEAFVRQLCGQWNVPLTVGRGDPHDRRGESLEEAARNLRYDFLRTLPGLIATAHHADDQAETVLLNLLRGTGLKGLCGMAFRNGTVIRPMLTVTGRQIEAYVREQNLAWRKDQTNDGDDALRNRLRHHIIPLLEAENPNFAGTVTRMTALLRQDEAYLEEQTQRLLEQARRDEGYHCPTLLAAPEVLRKRAVRQLLDIPKPAMIHVEQVAALLSGAAGSARVTLPGGMTAVREYDLLKRKRTLPCAFAPVVLRPGETVTAGQWRISLTWGIAAEGDLACREAGELLVRTRQTGDVLRLSGGRKTVKKLMIDRKIPAMLRDSLPVFEDAHGIVAVYLLGTDVSRSAEPGEPAWILHIEKEENGI